jgi:hypothetical protein
LVAYNKINSREEIKKLLQLMVDKELPFRVVRRDNEDDQDFYVDISKRMFEKDQDTILIETGNAADRKYLTDRNTFMSFFVDGGAAYYAKLKVIGDDPVGVVCKLPDLLFRVQRRRYYRVLVINKGFKTGFNSIEPDSKGLIVRDVIDIGIGGCSIHINKSDAGWMKIGDIMKGFKLKMEPNLYISPLAAIRFVGVVTMGNSNRILKCGIEFINMSPADEKELSYRVYSLQRLETFKYKNA